MSGSKHCFYAVMLCLMARRAQRDQVTAALAVIALMPYGKRKVWPRFQVVYMVRNAGLGVAAFGTAVLAFIMIQHQHLCAHLAPWPCAVEVLHAVIGRAPQHKVCNALCILPVYL